MLQRQPGQRAPSHVANAALPTMLHPKGVPLLTLRRSLQRAASKGESACDGGKGSGCQAVAAGAGGGLVGVSSAHQGSRKELPKIPRKEGPGWPRGGSGSGGGGGTDHSSQLGRSSQGHGRQGDMPQGKRREDAGRVEDAAQDRRGEGGGDGGGGKQEDRQVASSLQAAGICSAADHPEPQAVEAWCPPPHLHALCNRAASPALSSRPKP